MVGVSVILHIPHWSTIIPPDCRDEIIIGDDELRDELLKMTDMHTELAARDSWGAAVIKAEVSRLVVDVERFRDDSQEPMSKVGMGAVYTKTHNGHVFRHVTAERREALLTLYYDPHHSKLQKAVEEALNSSGKCLILDVHSFPSWPLPYESDQNSDRPDICIGTDDYHTPTPLAEAAINFYRNQGFQVKLNSPFGGSIVPLRYYRNNPNVYSVMIEFNRALLYNEKTGLLKQSGTEILYGVNNLATYIAGFCR